MSIANSLWEDDIEAANEALNLMTSTSAATGKSSPEAIKAFGDAVDRMCESIMGNPIIIEECIEWG